MRLLQSSGLAFDDNMPASSATIQNMKNKTWRSIYCITIFYVIISRFPRPVTQVTTFYIQISAFIFLYPFNYPDDDLFYILDNLWDNLLTGRGGQVGKEPIHTTAS